MVRQKSQQCPGCSRYCGPSAWGSERTTKDAGTVAASRAVSKIPQPDKAETIFQIVIPTRGKGVVVNLAALQTVVLVRGRVQRGGAIHSRARKSDCRRTNVSCLGLSERRVARNRVQGSGSVVAIAACAGHAHAERIHKGWAERVSFFNNDGFAVRKVLCQRVIEDQRKGQIRVVMDKRREEAVVVRKLPIASTGKKIFLGTIECLIVEQPNVRIHRAVIVQNRWRTGCGQWVKS